MTSTKRRALVDAVLLLLFCLPCVAQGFGTPPGKLPQDTGTAALKQLLRKLQTTARLMETTAHPDDEDGGMLTLESRGKGVHVLSLTLTRGEGGQNRTGSNLFDVLGILRTLEVMASDRYYGVEQRFTHVADFGFSKSPEETLAKWHDDDPALADIVRVIREFRPDVIVSRFQGAARDGHGHHQAAGILTREAFRAAADPNRFPEQIKAGLEPWQAKKLYVDNVHADEDYTLALETSTVDPVLGMSYVQLAVEGLKHQQSQGVGFRFPANRQRFSYYKLVDSVLPMPPAGTHEQNFFDGIDTSLPGLAARLGSEEKKVPFLRPALVRIQQKIDEAVKAAETDDPPQAAVPLLGALSELEPLLTRIENAGLLVNSQVTALAVLSDKRDQLREAVNAALGIDVKAIVIAGIPRPVDHPLMVEPGSSFAVAVTVINGGTRDLVIDDIRLTGGVSVPGRSPIRTPLRLRRGLGAAGDWKITSRADARYTTPYEHRKDPERDAVYVVDDPRYATLPFPPPPFHAEITYSLVPSACRSADKQQNCATSVITVPVEAKYINADGKTVQYPVAIGPSASVSALPATQIVPIVANKPITVDVHVSTPVRSDEALGAVSLKTPNRWKPPAVEKVPKGDSNTSFNVAPDGLYEGYYDLGATLDWEHKKYTQGYTVVTRPDLGEFFYYQPATQRISAIDLKVPSGLKVGYIMGAGDDIPIVLQQAGMDVHMITPEELATGDLGQYGTIVVGIRAYDVRDDVRANNKRLLDYAAAGGTLLVQYNANTAEFNAGHYTPYAAELSRERVTLEEAPVDVLAPQDSIFHFPNQITARDFDNWVQERGLYFMDKWDEHFQPLLACHDPGEPSLPGGLLRARYGKGTYIYTGYAFFRQLPAGVPGAVRLFVNLVSAGHEAAQPH